MRTLTCNIDSRFWKKLSYACIKALFTSSIITCLFSSCAKHAMTSSNQLSIDTQLQEFDENTKNFRILQQIEGGPFTADQDIIHYVNSIGNKVASTIGKSEQSYEFVVLNNSTPNVFALPGGKIAVTRGLLVSLQNEAELAHVLSHEIYHLKESSNETLKAQPSVNQQYKLNSRSINRDIIIPQIEPILNILQKRYSTIQEKKADDFATSAIHNAGYDPQQAVQLQEIYLGYDKEKNRLWLNGIFAQHPPSKDRAEACKKYVAGLSEGGYVGSFEYQQKLTSLISAETAYRKYEKARTLFHKGFYSEAEMLTQQAIKLYSNEALFDFILGQIQEKLHNENEALNNYSNAIGKNSQYFDFYYARARLENKLGMKQNAYQDLQMSLQLLETGKAHELIGRILLSMGQKDQAIAHLQKAELSQSHAAQEATKLLKQIEPHPSVSDIVYMSSNIDSDILHISIQNLQKKPIKSIILKVIENPGTNKENIVFITEEKIEVGLSKEIVYRFKEKPIQDPSITIVFVN